MIERRELDGRMATIAYFGKNFVPMHRDLAPFVKILFDDGQMLLLSRDQLPVREKVGALQKRLAALRHRLSGLSPRSGERGSLGKREWDESKHPRVPKGSGDASGEFTRAEGAFSGGLASEAAETDKTGPRLDGSFYVSGKTKNEIRELIHKGTSPAELDKHPALQMARAYQDTLGQTVKSKRDISTRLLAFREFNDGVVGYAAATDKLIETTKSYSKGGPVRNEREATIILGPPASGKSGFAEQLAARTQSAIVDPDDAKKMFPEFRGGIGANSIHEESSQLATFVYNRMMLQGTNMILPKLGAKASSIVDMTRNLKAMGYKVNLVNMDVHQDEAYRRGLLRFLNTGRLISATATAEADGNPTKTYNKLKASGDYNEVVNIDNNPPQGQHVITEGQETTIGRILGGTGRTRH